MSIVDLAAGHEVDRYVIEAPLGRGGMAVVYRVRHRQLGTEHALKLLTLPAPSIRDRLLQEGRAQAALRHPNIVAVTDVVEVHGAPGLVMDLVAGPTLAELLRRRELSIAQVDALGRGILCGVRAAHERGLVHRDLKPGNILLAAEGTALVPKIADFGLAKILGGPAGPALTRTGLAMGTPAYMAPEQIRNAKGVDERADLFSVGAVLYEMLTAERAFPGEDTFEVFSQVTSGRYRPIEELRPDAPSRMVEAVRRALEPDRERRVASCEALSELWTGGPEPASAPGGPWDPAVLSQARGAQPAGVESPAAPTPATGTWLDPVSSMEPPARAEPPAEEPSSLERSRPEPRLPQKGRPRRTSGGGLTEALVGTSVIGVVLLLLVGTAFVGFVCFVLLLAAGSDGLLYLPDTGF